MRDIYKILLFFILGFGPNVISYMGLEYNNYYLILVIITFIIAFHYSSMIDKRLIYLIVFSILYGVLKIFVDQGEGTRSIVLNAMAPAILFAAFPPIDKNSFYNIRIWKSLMCLLFLFYIVEAGLAVYERLTWHLVFGWANIHTVGMNVTATDFRSTALLGHPLANALIVSTIMSFFLVSPLNSKYKYLLWFWGFVAILCFNARAAIIGNVVVFLVYLIYTLRFNDKISSQEKNRIFWGVLLLAVLGIYLMANGYVGGRLLESGVNDESSQVRIDIWNVFVKYDLSSFMFGVSSHDLDMILNSLALYATENYWLDWVFRLGICFLVPYVLLYAAVIRNEYVGYSKINLFITLITFLGISSTNNSLSSSILPTFVFLFCVRIFNKETITYLIPIKYLDLNQI